MTHLIPLLAISYMLMLTSCAPQSSGSQYQQLNEPHEKPQNQSIYYEHHFGHLHEKLKHLRETSRHFAECTQGVASVNASPAADISPHPIRPGGGTTTLIQAVRLDNALLSDPTLLEHDQHIMKLLELVTQMRTALPRTLDLREFRPLFEGTLELATRLHDYVRQDEERVMHHGTYFERLLLVYSQAYLGAIRFTAAHTEIDLEGKARIVATGLVDRSGQTLAFPGASVILEVVPGQRIRLETNAPDSKRLAADLVRIYLEAFFDWGLKTPAAPTATAAQPPLRDTLTPQYPTFVPSPQFTDQDFQKVTSAALYVQAKVTALVGNAIRSGGPAALNNETLATVAETTAGVIAKKLAEHESYCYYWAKGVAPSHEKKAVGGL